MESHKVPVTITYRKRGTRPPMFLGGTYSDPPWRLQEMPSTLDKHGEHVFRTEILATPGSRIQYKFRVGTGNWWVLNDGVATERDNHGNVNNVLIVPQAKAKARALSDGEFSILDSRGIDSRGSEGVEQADAEQRSPKPGASIPGFTLTSGRPTESLDLNTIPGYGAASTDPWLDFDLFARKGRRGMDDDDWDSPQDRTPLFAHECLGSTDHDDVASEEDQHFPDNRRQSVGYEYIPIKDDLEDPQLEEFPSRIEQISELITEVEAGLKEDETIVEGVAPSAVVGVPRRRTNDFVGEFVVGSPSTSPAVQPRSVRRLEVPRTSRGSAGSEISSTQSLTSITEEAGVEEEEDERFPVITLPNTLRRPQASTSPPASDDDEAVVMKTARNGSPSKDYGKPSALPTSDSETSSHPDATANRKKSHVDTENRRLETKSDQQKDQISRPALGTSRDTANGLSISWSNDGASSPSPAEGVVQEPAARERDDSQSDVEEHDGDPRGQAGPRQPAESTTTSLTQRKTRTRPGIVQRCDTPTSIRSTRLESAKSGNWFRAFFRVFVDWVGGFFRRLFSGKARRKENLSEGSEAH